MPDICDFIPSPSLRKSFWNKITFRTLHESIFGQLLPSKTLQPLQTSRTQLSHTSCWWPFVQQNRNDMLLLLLGLIEPNLEMMLLLLVRNTQDKKTRADFVIQ